MERFGTKCPSMTSQCSKAAPPSSTARTCSPRHTKSAARIEGAISIVDTCDILSWAVERASARLTDRRGGICMADSGRPGKQDLYTVQVPEPMQEPFLRAQEYV